MERLAYACSHFLKLVHVKPATEGSFFTSAIFLTGLSPTEVPAKKKVLYREKSTQKRMCIYVKRTSTLGLFTYIPDVFFAYTWTDGLICFFYARTSTIW